MFRHQGETRTLNDNIRIATVLSFVAGIVNVVGFLFFKQMTSNVTGNFTLIIINILNLNFIKGMIYLLYIFSFLSGSFLSSLLIEIFKKNKQHNIYVLPISIECLILISIGVLSNILEIKSAELIICLLLFVMGLQNSLVTKISNAVVRTTHLTGLFTDLGIDISHLFFPDLYKDRVNLKTDIQLRIYIILFFFIGGLIGGYYIPKLI